MKQSTKEMVKWFSDGDLVEGEHSGKGENHAGWFYMERIVTGSEQWCGPFANRDQAALALHLNEVVLLALKTRGLIEDPAHWMRGKFAVDEHGESCDPHSDLACRWCISGALKRAAACLWGFTEEYYTTRHEVFNRLESKIIEATRENMTLTSYNDNVAGHTEMLAICDAVVEELHADLEAVL